jgi:hypothetical protein
VQLSQAYTTASDRKAINADATARIGEVVMAAMKVL